MSDFTLRFTKAKETKGTWQFQEEKDPSRDRPVVGTLYITKDVLKEMNWPQNLTVVVSS